MHRSLLVVVAALLLGVCPAAGSLSASKGSIAASAGRGGIYRLDLGGGAKRLTTNRRDYFPAGRGTESASLSSGLYRLRPVRSRSASTW